MSLDPTTTQATQTAIEETGKTIRHILDVALKEPLSEMGGVLTDQIKYWRLRNQIRIREKVSHLLQEKNISPTAQPDFVIPLLESSKDVEDELLANMFASLLASHLDPTTQENTHPSFAKIIIQITAIDAKILNCLYTGQDQHLIYTPSQQAKYKEIYFAPHELIRGNEGSDEYNRSIEIVKLSYQNLDRLGLCGFSMPNTTSWLQPEKTELQHIPTLQISLTNFGQKFMKACSLIP